MNAHGDGVDLRVIAAVMKREAGGVGGVLKLRGDLWRHAAWQLCGGVRKSALSFKDNFPKAIDKIQFKMYTPSNRLGNRRGEEEQLDRFDP